MDWLRDFQLSFREPVYGFLSTFWPVLGVIALMGLGWLMGSAVQHARRDRGRAGGGSADGGAASGGDSDGDGAGGD